MPWEEGESGNPAGRPKGARGKVPSQKEFEESYLKRSDLVVNTIVNILRDDKASDNAKLKAACWLGDKIYTITVDREKRKIEDSKVKGKGEPEEKPKQEGKVTQLFSNKAES